MANGVQLRFHEDPKRSLMIAEIHDVLRESIGRSATFTIHAKVKVHDSRAVNDDRELFRHDFVIGRDVHSIEIPLHSLKGYTYTGKMVDIRFHGKLRIDDAFIFDTTVEEEIALKLAKKPAVDEKARELVDPKDIFNFIANLAAVPHRTKIVVFGLLIAGLVVIAVNTVIGVHDQFVPDSATFVYSHTDSDGDASSPLFNSLALSGVAGAALWFAIRAQLRKYMRFKLKPLPRVVDRKQRFQIADVVEGSSRVDLEDVTLRVVACNMEKGQYKRGSGSNVRTVSFSEPIRGVLLYSQHVARIPRGEPVSRYFEESFSFAPMFAILYPPQMISDSHGLDVYWEVQLIHHDYVDQELKGPIEAFRYEDFLTGMEAGGG